MYDVYIFDCDGVVFNSNELKNDAFRYVLSEYPEDIVNEFILYHKANGGVSRYVKFELFITEFLGIKLNNKLLDHFLSEFSRQCISLYDNAVIIDGIQSCLEKLYFCDNFIASGGDEEELKIVFERRDLAKYFKGILGSPKTKIECIQQILDKSKSHNVIFIGDSVIDYDAATYLGIDFVFFAPFSDNLKGLEVIANGNNIPLVNKVGKLMDLII